MILYRKSIFLPKSFKKSFGLDEKNFINALHRAKRLVAWQSFVGNHQGAGILKTKSTQSLLLYSSVDMFSVSELIIDESVYILMC